MEFMLINLKSIYSILYVLTWVNGLLFILFSLLCLNLLKCKCSVHCPLTIPHRFDTIIIIVCTVYIVYSYDIVIAFKRSRPCSFLIKRMFKAKFLVLLDLEFRFQFRINWINLHPFICEWNHIICIFRLISQSAMNLSTLIVSSAIRKFIIHHKFCH